jgi:hypothetical protein
VTFRGKITDSKRGSRRGSVGACVTFSKIVPMAFAMVAGPQIISAIMFATREKARANSFACVSGTVADGTRRGSEIVRSRAAHPPTQVEVQIEDGLVQPPVGALDLEGGAPDRLGDEADGWPHAGLPAGLDDARWRSAKPPRRVRETDRHVTATQPLSSNLPRME